MCHPPTCVYRVYIAACCVICLIGAVAVIAIGMALGYRMGEDSVYNFKENRPNGIAVSQTNREQMVEVQSHFKHITTSLTGSGIVSGTISMIGGYGACCNLALALYLFMVGVAMLVVAEVATGAIVYYKQTLIMETLTEFRQNGICGVGQIVCAYCIVRRLSTPKPVRNIQHAVRRMTAHLFNIHSTAVAAGSSSRAQSLAAAAAAVTNIGESSPASATSTNNNNNDNNNNNNNNRNTNNNAPPLLISSLSARRRSQTPDPTTPQIERQAPTTLISEGAQTDDLQEITRPLLSSEQNVQLRRGGSLSRKPVEVEVIEETGSPQKSCIRYSISSRPPSVSSAKDAMLAAASEADQNSRNHQTFSNHIGKQTPEMQTCVVSVNVRSDLVDTTTSAQGYHSTSAIAYDSNTTTDAEQDSSPAVVVLQCLSPTSHQQHATTSSSGVAAATLQPSRGLKFEQTAAAASSTLTHQSSMSSRAGRVTKLIPTSCQSSLPAPHFVRKLNDFREIQQPQQQQQAHYPQQHHVQGSPSPNTRRRHLMIPIAAGTTPRRRLEQEQISMGVTSSSGRPYAHPAQTASVSEEAYNTNRPPVAQALRFAALPPSQAIHSQHASNIAKNRRARSYTNVGSTDEEAFEAADYIDLRELRRSPGTPGRVARFGHMYNNRNALLCSHPQQPPLFPQPAHAVGSYPDRSQWRLPEIRTLYVSYV